MTPHRAMTRRDHLRWLLADPVREQRHAALLSLAITLVLAVILYVALFDVAAAIEEAILSAIVAFALGAAAVVHFVSTPTRRLPHSDKVRREQRHAAMLTGALLGLLLLLSFAAAFDLDRWAEWTFFGVMVMTAVGAGVAVETPLR